MGSGVQRRFASFDVAVVAALSAREEPRVRAQ